MTYERIRFEHDDGSIGYLMARKLVLKKPYAYLEFNEKGKLINEKKPLLAIEWKK